MRVIASKDRNVQIYAKAVLLATGGIGRVYKETTNPDVATGDGVAAAYRAGAIISDIEFVQFHPTALYVTGAPRFLLTEALRGEGAYILNQAGERFMHKYDDRAELAPRDVVSRSIVIEMRRTETAHVFLDLTHLDAAFLRKRFPRVYETCFRHGVDITAAPVPVLPAAHYAMGGVRTDLHGCTNLQRLYTAGETACTGVHGANRLASNSLLEGLVFGARAGKAMRGWIASASSHGFVPGPAFFPAVSEATVRQVAWEHCGILRSGESLIAGLELLRNVALQHHAQPNREHHELRNIHAVAQMIAECALAREESRGAHYRTDFPERRAQFQKHSMIQRGSGAEFA